MEMNGIGTTLVQMSSFLWLLGILVAVSAGVYFLVRNVKKQKKQ
ncbi:hypothetical protein [Thermoactinomyces sp. DSM 45892]|nr:hypothetical protein [Thermoactinomyces sp. DSM 45892]SDZ25136.1 hypothetical protein SAMN05444416_11783 [Thermoactinomyces sp. DSM 45892]